eukprot:XP_001693210.1 predicted protein [Chlamydomonas reinhardtii]
MPSDESAEILQELQGLVHDELKVLSYKWVARQYSIPANRAKRVLFQFAEQQRDKVRTVYLVSGWTQHDPPSHVHQLVEAGQLQVCREAFGEVTGMHVYSVAPNQATNPDSLWQHTHQQSQQLLKEILSGEPSASADAFRTNSCSARPSKHRRRRRPRRQRLRHSLSPKARQLRKRRGAQIEDSDDEQEAAEEAAPAQQPAPPAEEATATGKGKSKGKGVAGTKENKGEKGGKRAKTVAVKEEALAVTMEAEEPAAEEEPAAAPASAPPAWATAGASTGAGGRGRKVTRTYINDDGEEVTEEGKAPAAGQKSMTSFFTKK